MSAHYKNQIFADANRRAAEHPFLVGLNYHEPQIHVASLVPFTHQKYPLFMRPILIGDFALKGYFWTPEDDREKYWPYMVVEDRAPPYPQRQMYGFRTNLNEVNRALDTMGFNQLVELTYNR